MSVRCDGKVDCQDTSDEMECNVLNMKHGSYNKDISPPTLTDQGLLDIDVSFIMDTILKVDEIDEVQQKSILNWQGRNEARRIKTLKKIIFSTSAFLWVS